MSQCVWGAFSICSQTVARSSLDIK